MQFGISIVLFTLLGRWLDGKLGTSPVLLLLGMGLGTSAGFYSMYRKLTTREREAAEARKKAQAGAGAVKRDSVGNGKGEVQ